MASTCEICHKGPGFGKAVSHSHRRTNRRWDPNIQSIRVALKPGKVRKLHVCVSCIKSGKVQRPTINI